MTLLPHNGSLVSLHPSCVSTLHAQTQPHKDSSQSSIYKTQLCHITVKHCFHDLCIKGYDTIAAKCKFCVTPSSLCITHPCPNTATLTSTPICHCSPCSITCISFMEKARKTRTLLINPPSSCHRHIADSECH